MEEIPLESMNMLTRVEFLTQPVNNTLLRILNTNVEPLIFAEIAHGHPPMQAMMVSLDAGQLPTSTTMLLTTTV